ncbi:unnamed protein product [Diabrotica balteata]|uniref:HAT C-terminal dimerisation domain-containing protein n=1 Tax=Diabrotica balteata TaxID=107213 RepID=A0A9N9TD85_DIABA|nr:unnamed protein product [Diabrotica balteata]
MYEQCVIETQQLITNSKKICVTTDCWTSSNMESYMGITVHYLDDDFKFISLLLDCSNLPVQHTSINLAKELKRVFVEWKVENKILMVVSDNAANIKCAIKNDIKMKHFGCFAHTINLIVNDGLKDGEIIKILNKIKNTVSHFKKSSTATAKLLDYQKNQGIGNPLKLLQDVSTRWNSTFYMLERFIHLEETVKAITAITNMDANNSLTMYEWNVIKQLCQILRPFEKVTKTISGEGYLTASLVIPLVNGLVSVFNVFKEKTFERAVRNVLIKLDNSIEERLENEETSGDPDDIWAEFDKTASQYQPRGTTTSRAIIEMQRFMECDRLPRNEDPLKWWRENKYIFPHLAEVAQERLSVIATSVPCERLFSKAGLIISDKRSRLNHKKAKMLLFLNSNLKVTNSSSN